MKKKITKILVFLCALMICVGSMQGDVWAKSKKSKKVTGPAVKSVSLLVNNQNFTSKTYQVKKSKSIQLKVNVNPANAKKSVKYWSTNKKIATVNSKGKITAKKKLGTATIKVKVTGKNKKSKTVWMKVKVTNTPKNPTVNPTPTPAPTPAPSTNYASQFGVTESSKTVTRNNTFLVQLNNTSNAGQLRSIRWYSDNENVVKVYTGSKYGSNVGTSAVNCGFTAVRPGSANIKVDLVGTDGSTKTCTIAVTVNESANYKTVNGVTFYSVYGYTSTMERNRVSLRAVEGNFNRNDVTIQITGATSKLVQNYASADRKLPVDYKNYPYFGGVYEVGTWPNIQGCIQLSSDSSDNVGMVAQPGTMNASYDVTIYYKGTYLHKWHVSRTPLQGEAKVLADCRSIESSCWTSDMTAEQKLHAFEKAFKEKYSYYGDGATCIVGTQYLVIAARDLGLEVWARVFSQLQSGKVVYNYPNGFGDDYQFATMPTGFQAHVGIIAVIDGKETVFETQGHK